MTESDVISRRQVDNLAGSSCVNIVPIIYASADRPGRNGNNEGHGRRSLRCSINSWLQSPGQGGIGCVAADRLDSPFSCRRSL